MVKVISVWGSPNSGKTTFTFALAQALSSSKHNVAVVCCDSVTPTIPAMFPQQTRNVADKTSKNRSIGKILSISSASENDYLSQFTVINNIGRLALVGYAYGETDKSYPAVTDYDVYNFYAKLEEIADYVLIDCASMLDNKLTSIALTNSDIIFRTCGADYKDIVFFASNLNLVPVKNIPLEKHIIVFANVNPDDAVEDTRGFYKRIDYMLYHEQSIDNMYRTNALLTSPFPQKYRKNINQIIQELGIIG